MNTTTPNNQMINLIISNKQPIKTVKIANNPNKIIGKE